MGLAGPLVLIPEEGKLLMKHFLGCELLFVGAVIKHYLSVTSLYILSWCYYHAIMCAGNTAGYPKIRPSWYKVLCD